MLYKGMIFSLPILLAISVPSGADSFAAAVSIEAPAPSSCIQDGVRSVFCPASASDGRRVLRPDGTDRSPKNPTPTWGWYTRGEPYASIPNPPACVHPPPNHRIPRAASQPLASTSNCMRSCIRLIPQMFA